MGRIAPRLGLLLAVCLLLASVQRALAESPDTNAIQALREELAQLREELKEQKEEHDKKIASMQGEIDRLKSEPRAPAPSAAGPEDAEDELQSVLQELTEEVEKQEAEPSFAKSVTRAFQSMNPDISVIGDFLGHYSSREDGRPDDEFLFRELELGISAPIDPYARADFFLMVGQEDYDEWEVELEEGYATFLTFPYDIQPRIGRFRANFGKANPVHLHALPWVEYPLMLQNYFGEEGLSGDGLGVSWLVPNPWDRYIELTYEITRNSNQAFAGSESDDFIHLAHLKDFHDLSDASTLEAGVSFATAPNDENHGSNRTTMEGLDLTYKWKPPEAGLYKSFLWQNEVLFCQADLSGGQENTWAMYSAADYQFARRWAVGARYDFSQLPISSSSHEQGYSTYLTFLQSEFLFWRVGYMYTDRDFDVDGNRGEHQLFLQCNFGIGPHRAHKY